MTHTKNISELVCEEIYNERYRQIVDEHFHQESDDRYIKGELAAAAACFANPTKGRLRFSHSHLGKPCPGHELWPQDWDQTWLNKHEDKRRKLVIAAALIVAEIERLDRIEPPLVPDPTRQPQTPIKDSALAPHLTAGPQSIQESR